MNLKSQGVALAARHMRARTSALYMYVVVLDFWFDLYCRILSQSAWKESGIENLGRVLYSWPPENNSGGLTDRSVGIIRAIPRF